MGVGVGVAGLFCRQVVACGRVAAGPLSLRRSMVRPGRPKAIARVLVKSRYAVEVRACRPPACALSLRFGGRRGTSHRGHSLVASDLTTSQDIIACE